MRGLRCMCVLVVGLAGMAATVSAAQAPRQRTAPPNQAAPPDRPAGEMKIAAVVNDDVISVYDLATRMRMVMMSSNIPDTPETRQRIGAQVLRNLIDEKLQLQEAKKQNVSASEEELNKALQQIEKQNNMKSGGLDEFLKIRGIDRGSLVSQLSASLVWAKLVRRQATQQTEISDDEIDDTLKRLKEHASEPQSRVAEIFLAVDNPAQEDETRRLAEKLSEQMRQGARFSAVAQQFSQSATAAVGGDIGWIRPDQLAPELGKAVGQLRPGELSPPIRSGGGFYLMLVVERRNGTGGGEARGQGQGQGQGQTQEVLDIVQVVFPLPPQASEAARRAALVEAQNIRSVAKDCPTLLKIGKAKAPQLSSEGRIRLDQIAPQMRGVISKLGIGQPSEPILQKNGVGVIMVCGKATGPASTAAASGPITREDAAETLIRQRLDTLARRYLRDLRRTAFVDVRV
jgi:peptidyl-prolyl cis-trans isomerase SurA